MCNLADFAVNLGVGLLKKSRNNTLYQSMENWFPGEKLIAWGKYFYWGKFAEKKMPNIAVTFLVKKKTCYSSTVLYGWVLP